MAIMLLTQTHEHRAQSSCNFRQTFYRSLLKPSQLLTKTSTASYIVNKHKHVCKPPQLHNYGWSAGPTHSSGDLKPQGLILINKTLSLSREHCRKKKKRVQKVSLL